MTHTTPILLAVSALLAFSGCTTTSTTAVDTKTAVANAASVASPLIEGGARIAVQMVLTKNPKLVDEFAAINTAAGLILATNDPTAEGFAAAVRTAVPDLTAAQASQIGAAIASAYKAGAALYKAQTGKDMSLTAIIRDPEYKASADALATALVSGITDGIADYSASLPSS